MTAEILNLASAVIGRATRARPADAVLRETLRGERGFSPTASRQVSRAVFAYYRWLGWLDRDRPLAGQIRYAVELAEAFAQRPASFSDEKLVERAVPGWARGQMEVTAAWVRAIQGEPQLWLRARRGQGRSLAGKLGFARATALPDALRYEGEADLFRRPEFHAGEFEIQDLSSQAVGWLSDPQPGETWWDACAGEGGKTLHLSELMTGRGLIWASDRSPRRLEQLKRRAARARVFNYRAVAWAGGPRLPTKTQFDGVLVDAPCSGTGTWQRNPHARWTVTAADVRDLAEIQQELLAHVAPAVKPGGKLVYAACTLTRAETVDVMAAFSKRFPGFDPLPAANPCQPGTAPVTPLWFWPQDRGGNGMFAALWRRMRG